MSITSLTYTAIGNNSYLVTAVSSLSTPTYYWYLDGVLVEASERASRQFDIYSGGVSIEVFDDSGDAPANTYPDRATLQWYPSDYGDAQKYVVRQWVDPDLTDLATLYDSGGRTVLRYVSPVLDGGANELRIYPVNEYGTEGEYRAVAFTMRKPVSPGVASITYDSGTTTLTAAVS